MVMICRQQVSVSLTYGLQLLLSPTTSAVGSSASSQVANGYPVLSGWLDHQWRRIVYPVPAPVEVTCSCLNTLLLKWRWRRLSKTPFQSFHICVLALFLRHFIVQCTLVNNVVHKSFRWLIVKTFTPLEFCLSNFSLICLG